MSRARTVLPAFLLGFMGCVAVSRAGPIADFETGVIPGPVEAEVQSVYDGDTMKVLAAIWPGQVVLTSVRLEGVDTPEIRGKCPEEKAKAKAARDRIRVLAEDSGSRVLLMRVQQGKYAGRVVASVVLPDGRDLSQLLIGEGLARPYDGTARRPWCEDQ